MKISRHKFVFFFLIFAFGFLVFSTVLLDSPPDTFLGGESQAPWQSILTTIASPIKLVIVGPLLPFINFMHQDPDTPPPFFLIGFILHWTAIALLLHFLVEKIK